MPKDGVDTYKPRRAYIANTHMRAVSSTPRIAPMGNGAPSRVGCFAYVMKNCDAFVFGPPAQQSGVSAVLGSYHAENMGIMPLQNLCTVYANTRAAQRHSLLAIDTMPRLWWRSDSTISSLNFPFGVG